MACDILIRKANCGDVDDIRSITREAFAEYAANTTAQRIDALFETADDIKKDIENKTVLAAVYGGRISGSLRLEISGNTAQLMRFAVRKENRSCGIGGMLIDYAVDFVREKGVKELYLHTDLNMKPLVGFYERRGFSVKSFENTRGYTRAMLVKIIE